MMEQDEVAELQEQCRLCLESDPSYSDTYHIDSSCGSITDKTVCQVIKYCLGFDVKSIGGSEFVPQQICRSCLLKLEETYEFKEKSQQNNETLKGILSNIGVTDGITDNNDDSNDVEMDESLLQEVDPPQNHENYTMNKSSERGSKLYTCRICSRTFKYSKPFMNHMFHHNPKYLGAEKLTEPDDEEESKTCSICSKTFKHFKAYLKHMSTRHNEDTSIDYHPPKYYKLSDQSQTHSEKRGRGRPRKVKEFSSEDESLVSKSVMNDDHNRVDYPETSPSYKELTANNTTLHLNHENNMFHTSNYNGAEKLTEPDDEEESKTCTICSKTFKYYKPYVKHMLTHNEDISTDYHPPKHSELSNENQMHSEKKERRGRPRKIKEFSSEDESFHDTLISKSFMNEDNDQVDFSETSSSYPEPIANSTLQMNLEKRGRGRPRKKLLPFGFQKNALKFPMTRISASSTYKKKTPDERKMHWKQKLSLERKAALIKQENSTSTTYDEPQSSYQQDEYPDPKSLLSSFVEVDLKKVLKKRTIDEIPATMSKSLKKIKVEKSRSRSPSIELIQEQDIFTT